MSRIDMSRPIRGEWVGRGFGRRFVLEYRCPNGHTVKVRCTSWRGLRIGKAGHHAGRTPQPGQGAISCPQCERDKDNGRRIDEKRLDVLCGA